jgi:hypothetical protein
MTLEVVLRNENLDQAGTAYQVGGNTKSLEFVGYVMQPSLGRIDMERTLCCGYDWHQV